MDENKLEQESQRDLHRLFSGMLGNPEDQDFFWGYLLDILRESHSSPSESTDQVWFYHYLSRLNHVQESNRQIAESAKGKLSKARSGISEAVDKSDKGKSITCIPTEKLRALLGAVADAHAFIESLDLSQETIEQAVSDHSSELAVRRHKKHYGTGKARFTDDYKEWLQKHPDEPRDRAIEYLSSRSYGVSSETLTKWAREIDRELGITRKAGRPRGSKRK